MLRGPVASSEVNDLCGILKRRCGLVLSDDGRGQVANRLRTIALQAGAGDLGELTAMLRSPGSEGLMARVADAMLNHDTAFFRDAGLFRHVREALLPAQIEARRNQRHLRIWCAAASTGQEAYSLAMILGDMPALGTDWRIDLVATDLSEAALTRAAQGAYSQSEVQYGLPIDLLLRHFQQVDDDWQIADHLRAMVRFQQANLLDDFSGLGTFDIIFCRNVLSGLDPAIRFDVLRRMVDVMAPEGCLVLDDSVAEAAQDAGFMPIGGMRGIFGRKRLLSPRLPRKPSMHGRHAVAPHLTVVGGHG